MKTISIQGGEFYNEATEEFIQIQPVTIQMEHSLISISKWEAKWHKPFLDGKEKTRLELLDYFRCMTITPNVDPLVYSNISVKQQEEILEYMNDPMTGTTINDRNKKRGGRQVLSAELIYYYMTAFNIPFECEKWHINRLFTLIRVCDIKSQGSQAMSKKDVANQNRMLNAARRGRIGSRG